MRHDMARAGAAGLMMMALAATSGAAADGGPGYEALTALFAEWREFQKPRIVHGVPDYSAPAMAAQHQALPEMKRRLAAIDPRAWPVSRQVDYHLVRAEMNGLDFDQRVLKPWAENPAFYVTVYPDESDQPAREGPFAWGGIDLWRYAYPLSAEDAAEVKTGLDRIPPLLEQARVNLTGDRKDLWTFGAKSLRRQSDDLKALGGKVREDTPGLAASIEAARAATDALASWVETQSAAKSGPSGVGVENYDWYLKNVQLVPYTWREEVTLMERELARARSFLILEEERNRGLPELVPVLSADEHARRFEQGVRKYMTFLADHEVVTIAPYMERALREHVGSFTPGPRDFFTEVDYRDPEVMRTHGYHWFDLARMVHEPHESPIRRGPLLYNIFDSRTEGLATGWEEMMLQAGMFDESPRSREMIYVLLAQRAARALGELKVQANELTLDGAARFTSANTPRGWLRLSLDTVWGEQHLYLQQPGYGTSYMIGKIEVEKLLRDRAGQLGDAFTMKGFMDELNAAGLIPVSLLRWEMTGMSPEIAGMLAPE